MTHPATNLETLFAASPEPGGASSDVNGPSERVQPHARLGEGRSGESLNRKNADPSGAFQPRNLKDRFRECDGKHRYPDKKSARSEINFILNRRHRNRPDHLRAYHCRHCNGWHLTKRS